MDKKGQLEMNKTETIARRIFGWSLNRWDRWFDYENARFIDQADFQPEHNLDHAMLVVEKLQEFGITYTKKGENEACFNDFCANGNTLAEAITNAAFLIADGSGIDDGWL